MKLMRIFWGTMLAASALASGLASATPLWEIGKRDGSCAEFALAPNGYPRFAADGFYAVGISDTAKVWPYVQPGPADPWAGSRPHTFSVLFALDSTAAEGECALEVDLADTHGGFPPQLRISVNGTPFDHATPPGGPSLASINGKTAEGKAYRFRIAFPCNLLHAGINRIAIASIAGSWMLYDCIGLEAPRKVRLAKGVMAMTHIVEAVDPGLSIERNGELRQIAQVTVEQFGAPAPALIEIRAGAADGAVLGSVQTTIDSGPQTVEVHVTPAAQDTPAVAVVTAGSETVSQELMLKPVRKWTVYLLHHTHLDIGYTHVQTEVERIQWNHLDKALDLIAKTTDYPPEARFKWLPEGLWAVDSYLQQAPEEKRQAFAAAVRQGRIGLDGLYGNELTALCRPEELLELTGAARRLAQQYDLTLDSAMISDVPGYTWGMVPALVQSGIKYFSIGPNSGHRIGYTIEAWGDRPFYWMSPSGTEKLLCWVAGKGYSFYHGDHLRSGGKLLAYLRTLDTAQYPYDIVQVRYNIGGDNGPPDEGLSDFVRDWNSRYAYPKLVIATVSELFQAFEARYAAALPEVRGDFTPYWEDGAASSARETAINREAAERLVQAQTIWTMLASGPYPAKDFQSAWRDIILYDEHTWGAHNSISEPECDFVRQQWDIKRAFAVEADRKTRELLERALEPARAKNASVQALWVFNTCSWPRTDLVTVPPAWSLPGEVVKDAHGKHVPTQRLSSGALAFVARDVPPLAAARFTVHEGTTQPSGQATVSGMSLSDGQLELRIGEGSGAIVSLVHGGEEWVDGAAGLGLNEYLYVEGRQPDNPRRVDAVTVSVLEPGPLVAALRIASAAPGCNGLVRDVQIVSGLDRVDIVDAVDRKNVYSPDAVHLAFPFQVPGGVLRMDVPWAVVSPEVDQLEGSCKNYFTVQRWVDVSNEQRGMTCAVLDAPMIEIGKITCDARHLGWIKTLEASATWYSYAMNNYWETNYKASQEGVTVFRYALRPHAAYDGADAQRFGIERSQPLVVLPADPDARPPEQLLMVTPSEVIVTACKPSDNGKDVVVRLFNTAAQPVKAKIRWGTAPKETYLATISETAGAKAPEKLEMPPFGIVTLRATFEKQ